MQLCELQRACQLYPKVLDIIEQIISDEDKLNDSVICRKLGYAEPRKYITVVWRGHPQLSKIIARYKWVMSNKSGEALAARIARKERLKRLKKTDPLLASLRQAAA